MDTRDMLNDSLHLSVHIFISKYIYVYIGYPKTEYAPPARTNVTVGSASTSFFVIFMTELLYSLPVAAFQRALKAAAHPEGMYVSVVPESTITPCVHAYIANMV